MRNNSFCIKCWVDLNPKELEYLDDIYKDWRKVEKVRKTITDKDCFEKGIVTSYGITNVENDFNEYSAMIFTSPEKFKKIMEQYPRVRKKFLVWLNFYQSIDPIFTEGYLFGKNVRASK
jgi:hypothetical protein